MVKRIYVRDLKEGYTLEDDIQYQNSVLVKKGTVLTEALVSRIRQWFKNLDTCVNIKSEECTTEEIQDANAATCISEELKQDTITGIKDLYNATSEQFEEAYLRVKDCAMQIAVKMKAATNLCYDIDNLAESHKEEMEEHLFRVAKLAIALANVNNNSVPTSEAISLADIGLAALFHDYGKGFKERKDEISRLKVDAAVFKKLNLHPQMLKRPFSEEFHSIYAYLKLKGRISDMVCRMILLSGLHNDAVNKFGRNTPEVRAAKIITLCYVYDSLLESVVKNNISLPLENVLSVISQQVSNGNLSESAYKLFMDNILIYAPGTKVLLTTGEYATVVRNTSHFPTKPMVYTDNTLGIPRLLDLSQTTTITIKHFVNSKSNIKGKVHEIEGTQLKKIVTP